MQQATVSETINVGGVSFGSSITLEAEGSGAKNVDLAAGVAGTLTTRTDDNTGVVTVAEGHGIEETDTVDLYWDGGLRYGMTCTHDATTISIDGGAGDVLPAAQTVVVICKRTEIEILLTGDNIELIVAKATQRASVVFYTSVPAEIYDVDLEANVNWSWRTGLGTNPLAGESVAAVQASSGAVTAANLKIGYLTDDVA